MLNLRVRSTRRFGIPRTVMNSTRKLSGGVPNKVRTPLGTPRTNGFEVVFFKPPVRVYRYDHKEVLTTISTPKALHFKALPRSLTPT